MSLQDPVERQPGSTKRPRMAPERSPVISIVDVDSLCFTPLLNEGTSQSNAISVEQYTEDRDLQLAIMAGRARPAPAILIDLSDADDDDEVRLLRCKPQNTGFGKRRKLDNFASSSTAEKGESSNCPPFFCEICTETKTAKESFSISGCSHAYCTECIVRYVGSKLQENVINIRCPVPDCRGLLEPYDCSPILPPEVFDRWGIALCEAVILTSEKFYCPFKDCSALLIDDGKETIKESECPNCGRLFCVQCKVPWHMGMDCEEFQKLNKDERENGDIMLMQLALNKKWRRCPKCRFYVEKSSGCMYMRCRCGIAFCYNCGAPSIDNSHNCHNCAR